MPSKHQFHLVKVEVEEDQMLEEEEEAHTEVEEVALQAQVEGATIKIQVKAQAKIKTRKKQYDISNKPSANFTKENQNQDIIFLAFNVAQEKQRDVWFLDSGCNNHMTGNIEMFSNLYISVKSKVTLGTDSKVFVMGKGRVNILTKKGETTHISDVYFVHGLKHNLISIGQPMKNGYNVFFKNDECTILHKSPSRQMIAKVQMTSNRMFPLKIKSDLKEEGAQAQLSMNSQEDERKVAVVTQLNFQEEVKDENWLWHLRFGHINFGGLNLLNREGMLKGLPLIKKPDSLCEGCILGKQHRETFPSGKSIREKAPLEIVHSDFRGPM
eukprot:PITA_26611